MKKIKILLIALAFAAVCLNVFGEAKTNAFSIKVSGRYFMNTIMQIV